MKKWIAVFLGLLLVCTTCCAMGEEDADAIVDKGNEALAAKDYATALEMYTRAADLGNARGVSNLGWLCQNRFGVERDYEKAIAYYEKASAMGQNVATANLGWLYYNGEGV